MGFRIITETPRGEIITQIPIAVEVQGAKAIDAFVAADVEQQLAALGPAPDATPEE